MRTLLTIIALALFPTLCLAKGKKAPKVVITFHLESTEDLGGKMTFKWQTALGKMHFRRSSEFKTDMIYAQRPFPSPHDDKEYGMIFKFNKDGKRHLKRLTNLNRGKHIIVFMNGQPIDMLRIDKQVDDGIICVWRGLTAAHVHLADSLVPRIGEDRKAWEKRRKLEAKKKKK